MPKRVFTYEEAVAILPEVRRITGEAAGRVEAVETEDPGEYQRIVGEWAAGILAMGIEVKGLWLIDFDSGGGYYCWRFPEQALEYFHGYDESFSGRVKLN